MNTGMNNHQQHAQQQRPRVVSVHGILSACGQIKAMLKDAWLSRYGTSMAIKKCISLLVDQRSAFKLGEEFFDVFKLIHTTLCEQDTYNLAYVTRLLQGDHGIPSWSTYMLSNVLNQYVDTSKFFTMMNMYLLYKASSGVRKAFLRGYFTRDRSFSIHLRQRSAMQNVAKAVPNSDARQWIALYDWHPIYILWIYSTMKSMAVVGSESSVVWNMPHDLHSIDQSLDDMPYKMVITKNVNDVMDQIYTLLHWLYYDKDQSYKRVSSMLFSDVDAELYAMYTIACRNAL